MDITSLGLLNATRQGEGGGAASLADNFDNFLTLLTTQLQHQNPLEPMESTEFTQQLVQFASVEQAINTNETLKNLLEVQQRNESLSAAALAGSEVEVFTDRIEYTGDPVSFSYQPESAAESVSIKIVNESGQIVRSFQGETSEQKHQATWDGLDSQSLPVPEGVYRVQVDAVDADEKAIDVSTTYAGTVTSVTAKDGGMVSLEIGAVSVPLDNILSVAAPVPAGDDTTA